MQKKKITLPGASIWELDYYKPMAFLTDNPQKAFRYSFSGNGMNIFTYKISDSKSTLTANVLYRPYMIARDNQNRVLNIKPDFWGRMKIDIPNGINIIKIKYEPPIALGLLITIFLLLISFLSYKTIFFFLNRV